MGVSAGGRVNAADVNGARTYYKRKTAAQTVTNSIVLVNDADFAFTIPAGKQYLVQARLSAGGPAAADLRLAWAVTGGVAQLNGRAVTGPGLTTASATDGTVRATASHGLATNLQYGLDGVINANISEDFMVETTTAGTSGTLTMQFAQFVANAAGVSLTASSFVVLTEIEVWT